MVNAPRTRAARAFAKVAPFALLLNALAALAKVNIPFVSRLFRVPRDGATSSAYGRARSRRAIVKCFVCDFPRLFAFDRAHARAQSPLGRRARAPRGINHLYPVDGSSRRSLSRLVSRVFAFVAHLRRIHDGRSAPHRSSRLSSRITASSSVDVRVVRKAHRADVVVARLGRACVAVARSAHLARWCARSFASSRSPW